MHINDSFDGSNFHFDRVFRDQEDQESVYETVGRPVVSDVLAGFNGTIFAYGQTGSGKTYTMMGTNIEDEAEKGVIPRAATHIFEAVENSHSGVEWAVKCSILEIYNEKVQDLLSVENGNLAIKESGVAGIYVENLSAVVRAYTVCRVRQ